MSKTITFRCPKCCSCNTSGTKTMYVNPYSKFNRSNSLHYYCCTCRICGHTWEEDGE